MKKKIFFVILLSLFITSNLLAQFKYGPRVGSGLSQLGGGNAGVGFHVGVFINAELLDRFGFQPEVLYSIKTGNQKIGTTEHTYNFSYIDVPFYVYFPLSKHLRVMVGPMLANIGSAKVSYGSNEDDIYAQTTGGFAVGLDTDTYSRISFGIRYRNTAGKAFAGGSSSVDVTVSYTMDW